MYPPWAGITGGERGRDGRGKRESLREGKSEEGKITGRRKGENQGAGITGRDRGKSRRPECSLLRIGIRQAFKNESVYESPFPPG
jgi:hypothetical protein